MRSLAPDLEINLAHEPTFFEFAQNEFVGKPHRAVVAYLGTARRRIAHVDVLPWQQEFFKELATDLL